MTRLMLSRVKPGVLIKPQSAWAPGDLVTCLHPYPVIHCTETRYSADTQYHDINSISADLKDLDLDSFNLVEIELCCMIYNVSVFTCGHPVGI